jgi:hypothetical protein
MTQVKMVVLRRELMGANVTGDGLRDAGAKLCI